MARFEDVTFTAPCVQKFGGMLSVDLTRKRRGRQGRLPTKTLDGELQGILEETGARKQGIASFKDTCGRQIAMDRKPEREKTAYTRQGWLQGE